MTAPRPPRQVWQLQASDFTKRRVYAKQDWRFQMFFEYLRFSPSYAAALACSDVNELAEQLGDAGRAAKVWQTRLDMGNVFEALYKEWWLERGLNLFGIHAQRPRLEQIQRLSPSADDAELLSDNQQRMGEFLTDRYAPQGRPDSVLVSIPLDQKRATTIRQLKKLLTEINSTAPPVLPSAKYMMEANKMRYRRLLAGVRLVYHRAARPNDELWRIASRAKISPSHVLDPKAQKKDAKSAEARRLLTIMASRLWRDSLIVAENASLGRFPSLQPINVKSFDVGELGQRLNETMKWERARKAELKREAK